MIDFFSLMAEEDPRQSQIRKEVYPNIKKIEEDSKMQISWLELLSKWSHIIYLLPNLTQ